MPPAPILTLDEESFDDELKRTRGPILVNFWASWCAPSKRLAATLDGLSEELAGRVVLARVDVDECGDLAHRFAIRSVPTLVLFKDGRVVDRVVGAAPKVRLLQVIERHLDPTPP